MAALAAKSRRRQSVTLETPPRTAGRRSRDMRAPGDSPLGPLQPKLRVNEPQDPFEREADRTADQVMGMRAPAAVPVQRAWKDEEEAGAVQRAEDEEEPGAVQRAEDEDESGSVQRAQDEEEEAQASQVQRAENEEEEPSGVQRAAAGEEEEPLQQRARTRHRPRLTPQFESDLKALSRKGGQPLPDPVRAFVEPRFGHPFDDVRVHAGPEASALARQANARAFTVGRHIVFGAGEYRPSAEQGLRLIAHELTHVLQQRGGLHSVQREIGAASAVAEPSRGGAVTLDALRDAFDLDSALTPPSVLSVALDLIRSALESDDAAARLRPFLVQDGTAGAVVRRVESARYTLQLVSVRTAGGAERKWSLTNRAMRHTFASRPRSTAAAQSGTLEGTDEATIEVTSHRGTERFSEQTIVAALDSTRESARDAVHGPTPPLAAVTPEGTVPERAQATSAPEVRPVDVVPPNTVEGPPHTPAEPLGPTRMGEELAPAAAAAEMPEEAEEAALEEPERAPTDPKEDPAFQQTLGQIKSTRRAQADHATPDKKRSEMTASAFLPEEQQQLHSDRDQHLETIDEESDKSKTRHFTPDTFKTELNKSLDSLNEQLPDSESEAEKFKRDKPLEGVKEEIRSGVTAQNELIAGPLAKEVEAAQAPPGEPRTTKPADLIEELPGDRPRPIASEAAAPKPRFDSEISLEAESASLDELMVTHDLTEEQLAESNEPTFIQALDTKREAQAEAAAAPGRYREKEAQILTNAQRRAGGAGAAGFKNMFGVRTDAFTAVFGAQDDTAKKDKDDQTGVHKQFADIYGNTKKDVDKILECLSTSVDGIFSTKVEAAKSTFETRVEAQIDDIYGITVIDDWLFGEDTEAIEEVFRTEKAAFIATMNTVIDEIAILIADELNAAIKRIDDGRAEGQRFFDGLSDRQQQLAKGAFEQFKTQFAVLEDSVRDKQQELADSLAQSYKENIDTLRESFDKIKEEVSKGWIGKAIDFVVSVATTIYKLGQLLWSILTRIGNVIGDILAHPIRFLENLAAGVSQGFREFIERIDEYLLAGFFDWLRGTVGGPGIQLPDKFDASGIFNLVAQVLGLGFETFRKIAVKVWGRKPVEIIEQGAGVVRKGLELFYIVREKGLGGLWEHIRATVSERVDEIVTKVKEMIVYETVKKALAYIASLFIPAGAFIKAAQAIYAGLRFLMDNIERIAELVDAFLTSVELAVKGQVGGIAKKIVTALRGVVVLAIDFLAKLLRLGKLDEKARRVLGAIRRPVERAIEAVLRRLKPHVLRLVGRGAKKKKQRDGGRQLTSGELVPLVVKAMSVPPQASAPAAALAEKKAQAKKLIRQYQPRLKKGKLRIVITDPSAVEVEKDAAVDFDVSASPGTKGEARLVIDVGDDTAIRRRYAHARSLKKFTGEKGFVLSDWSSTFTDLAVATHAKDLQFGVANDILEKQESTYFFGANVPRGEIVERGALEIQDNGRSYERFKGRFGVPLIQAFLAGRKIAGILPDTFGDTALVSDVAARAEKAGAIDKLGKTNTWTFPEVPAQRDLPADWGGATHVRPRYYERKAGFDTLARDVFIEARDGVITDLIEEQIEIFETTKKGATPDMGPWQEMIKRKLAQSKEEFDVDAARAGEYYRRERYDVDHVESLAEHWSKRGGNNTDRDERIAATRGESGGLAVMERGLNRSKGSDGITYVLWVGRNFTTPGIDQYHADVDELFDNWA